MRRLWSTLALFVVLAGLGGYIYFTGAKPAEDANKQDKLFPGVEGSQISELKVKNETGDETTVKKEDGVWKITAPITVTAADNDTSGIANALADMTVVRVVDEAPANLKEYGLDPARIAIDFKTADGKSSGRLLVGEKTATGGNLYARRDDQKRVVLIGQFYETSLNQSTFALRDKTIVKLDQAKVNGLDITVDGKAAEFAKTDGDWKMTKPVAARADASATEGIITRVTGAQMKSIASSAPTPEELKKFGLDKPQVAVNVHLGGERAGLLVGGKADDGSVYVRDVTRPDVFTIEASSAEDFKKPVEDYRRKEAFDFRAFNATRVEVTADGKTLTLERVKATTDGAADTWKRLTPTPGDAEREKVESFLAGLADMRAVSFVPAGSQTGLNKPAMTVTAKYNEGAKDEKVTFGKAGDAVFAARTDDPGAMKVDPTKFDEAIKAFTELAK